MSNITDVDQKILDILKINARESLSSISRQIHLSRTAVQARLKKMEDLGIITGYRVEQGYLSNKDKLGAIIGVKTGTKNRKNILDFVKKNKIVISCYSMTGNSDLEILVRENSAIKEFAEALWEREDVLEIETKIVLKEEFTKEGGC